MMATNSIFVSVKVKQKTDSKTLFAALEHAEGKKAKDVKLSRPVEEIRGKKVKDLFK